MKSGIHIFKVIVNAAILEFIKKKCENTKILRVLNHLIRVVKYQGEANMSTRQWPPLRNSFVDVKDIIMTQKICSFCAVNITDKDIFSIQHC